MFGETVTQRKETEINVNLLKSISAKVALRCRTAISTNAALTHL